MESFIQRLGKAVDAKKSCVVVGLDPILERLPRETLSTIGHNATGGEGLTARAAAAFGVFLGEVIELVREDAVAVKPNVAFFERYGAVGWDCLRQVCHAAQKAGLLVILDAKRGDIGPTASAYVDALLGDHPDTVGPYVDAVTLNPYLGRDSMAPFIDRARAAGKGIFALVRTSNPSAAELQDLPVDDGRPLFVHVAERVAAWGKDLVDSDGWSSVGAVVGATSPDHARAVRAVLPRACFLLPGVGAQGARPEDLAACFSGDPRSAVVAASRSILFAYEGKSSPWRDAIRAACAKLRVDLEAVRTG